MSATPSPCADVGVGFSGTAAVHDMYHSTRPTSTEPSSRSPGSPDPTHHAEPDEMRGGRTQSGPNSRLITVLGASGSIENVDRGWWI